MIGLAIAAFVALFAFGGQALGWHDYDGSVQAALAVCFGLGVLCGYLGKS